MRALEYKCMKRKDKKLLKSLFGIVRDDLYEELRKSRKEDERYEERY